MTTNEDNKCLDSEEIEKVKSNRKISKPSKFQLIKGKNKNQSETFRLETKTKSRSLLGIIIQKIISKK